MNALLIEFDKSTGIRAGNISPKDSTLPCRGWQDLDSTPAREIRLVTDGRDLSKYHKFPGVTVLNNDDEINTAIDSLPDIYKVEDEAIMLKHMEHKGINLDEYAGKSQKDILMDLYNRGIAGITKRQYIKVG